MCRVWYGQRRVGCYGFDARVKSLTGLLDTGMESCIKCICNQSYEKPFKLGELFKLSGHICMEKLHSYRVTVKTGGAPTS